jgi:molecular chaperone GrpE
LRPTAGGYRKADTVTSDTPNDTEAAENDAEAAPIDPLEAAEAKIAGLKDQLLRTAADYDNYRKRARREVEDALAAGREAMLKDLLPVFDNLERATAHADSVTDLGSFTNGIQMVMRQFVEALKRAGIERVPGLGAAFDPSVHEAIQHLETKDYQPGAVAAEVQPGYRLGERLIRPALVVVAKAPSTAAEESHAEGDGPN